MSVLAFPVPTIERYSINYDPVTRSVDIPLIADASTAAADILSIFMDMLVEEGTLTIKELETILLAVKMVNKEEP